MFENPLALPFHGVENNTEVWLPLNQGYSIDDRLVDVLRQIVT